MKRLIKITIQDFHSIEQHLNDAKEIELYRTANGNLYEAVIEHDDYAVVDLTDEEYIELAPGEYQIMITEWKTAGRMDEIVIETMSDPDDDASLVYRGVHPNGSIAIPVQSVPKQLIKLLFATWFGKEKSSSTP